MNKINYSYTYYNIHIRLNSHAKHDNLEMLPFNSGKRKYIINIQNKVCIFGVPIYCDANFYFNFFLLKHR